MDRPKRAASVRTFVTTKKDRAAKKLSAKIPKVGEKRKREEEDEAKQAILRKRPALSKGITAEDLRDFYWVEELRQFCKEEHIKCTGKKSELINRVLEHVGEIKARNWTAQRSKRVVDPKADGKLHRMHTVFQVHRAESMVTHDNAGLVSSVRCIAKCPNRTVDTGVKSIFCEACRFWLHCDCLDLADPDSIQDYNCPECVKKQQALERAAARKAKK
eukprot:gnl/Spiro4/8035_TR4231_c0_g1_i1.p2 gnl/Spiro4/8035_TR4231_c0_g1~~gnl/Spiro4/8035_TR4231_c0_g1_i1.p2  ORF type:complete len:217 (-),score=77.11 gnl/Spiro4/8035_TR4231_c0_g1_i1:87-737(-)